MDCKVKVRERVVVDARSWSIGLYVAVNTVVWNWDIDGRSRG